MLRPSPALPLVLLTLLLAAAARADDAGFTPLFDGETLDGWEGNMKMFRVEDGAIVAGSLKEKVPHNEFLATTKQYGDFELRLEAKLVGQGKNAGVQFRSKRIPNHHEVIGYQCDMGVMKDRNIWGWLYDESRRRKFLAESADEEAVGKAFREGQWNRLRVRCEGPRIRIWVNDVPTIDYTEAQGDIARSGIIALQIHGGPPAEASYRKIAIKELDRP